MPDAPQPDPAVEVTARGLAGAAALRRRHPGPGWDQLDDTEREQYREQARRIHDAGQPARRHTASDITDDALTALYEERDQLRDRAARAESALERGRREIDVWDTGVIIRPDLAAIRRALTRTAATPEPNWECPRCDGLVPYSERHIHELADADAQTHAQEAH